MRMTRQLSANLLDEMAEALVADPAGVVSVGEVRERLSVQHFNQW